MSIKVNVEVHPTSGPKTKRAVTIEGTGVSVKEFLEQADLSATNMNISVNGEPASLSTHVGKNATVTLTEKARGS